MTEQKKNEEARKKSEENLQLAVNGAHLGTFYCDVPFDKIIWNDLCKEHFFLPQDAEIDFDLFYARLHPEDRERTRQAIDQCMNERTQYNVEYRVVALDGRMRWINAIGAGYYLDTGEPYRFDGITIDITEKKNHEHTLSFFVALNDATRDIEEPEAIMLKVAQMLGEFMQVSRCGYGPVEEDHDHFTVYGDYTNGCETIVGRHSLKAFGSKAFAELSAGKTYVVYDIEEEIEAGEDLAAFRQTKIHAAISSALVKNDVLVGLMGVHQNQPRRWTPEEVELVEMVAERLWVNLERARADKLVKARAKEIADLNVRLKRAMTETHHRVKNNLQMISAMIEMQTILHRDEKTVPIEEFIQLKAHVHTLATVHDLLTKSVKEGYYTGIFAPTGRCTSKISLPIASADQSKKLIAGFFD